MVPHFALAPAGDPARRISPIVRSNQVRSYAGREGAKTAPQTMANAVLPAAFAADYVMMAFHLRNGRKGDSVMLRQRRHVAALGESRQLIEPVRIKHGDLRTPRPCRMAGKYASAPPVQTAP